MNTKIFLEELRVKTQNKILSALYKNSKYFKLRIDLINKSTKKEYNRIDVKLFDYLNKSIDCSTNHFGYNFFFRTTKGIKEEKYKSLKTLMHQVKKACNKNNYEIKKYYLIINNKEFELITKIDNEFQDFFSGYMYASLFCGYVINNKEKEILLYERYTIKDFSKKSIKKMKRDCLKFYYNYKHLFYFQNYYNPCPDSFNKTSYNNFEIAGMNFLYSRNHEGTGFFDDVNLKEKHKDFLQKKSEEFKEICFWINKNNKIEIN